MTFSTDFASCFVLVVIADASPVAGMGVSSTGFRTVALNTDIAIRMTGLAGLQVTTCLGRMLTKSNAVYGLGIA